MTKRMGFSFGFHLRSCFCGTHGCGTFVESVHAGAGEMIDDVKSARLIVLHCGPCDADFLATHARLYFVSTGHPDKLLKEMTLEQFSAANASKN